MAHTAHAIQAKTKVTTIRFTPDQHKLIDQRAKKSGVRMRVWLRSVVLQALSKQPTKEGFLHIREPDGATI